jgi:hypothetical protein
MIGVVVPVGWLRQIDRIGNRTKVLRAIIGSALAARNKVKGGDGVVRIDADVARSYIELWHYTGTLPTGRKSMVTASTTVSPTFWRAKPASR